MIGKVGKIIEKAHALFTKSVEVSVITNFINPCKKYRVQSYPNFLKMSNILQGLLLSFLHIFTGRC